ncbi:hypothetical protein [Streptomyces sp. NPDC050564]|uniref:hypothetical protein n=1 Tax=Streptomyces sp. NPDC050564 TaxID=3365631 RepID=UPI003795014F
MVIDPVVSAEDAALIADVPPELLASTAARRLVSGDPSASCRSSGSGEQLLPFG